MADHTWVCSDTTWQYSVKGVSDRDSNHGQEVVGPSSDRLLKDGAE